MIQLVFGFFATAGAESADWGAVNRSPRDVQLGGWVGVGLASWVVATLALLTIAGAVGRAAILLGDKIAPGITDYRYQTALLLGVGGPLAGTMLLIFGLASLGPTCYTAFVFGHRFAALWPRVSRIRWTLLGTAAAWLLIASGLAGRLETIFSIMGAVFAPVVGAMAADYLRHRGTWPGPRRGINLAGLIAWGLGVMVGLVPWLVPAWETRFQPAAVLAFLTGLLIDAMLARLGLEPPIVPLPGVTQPSEAA
jgi:cytosine permease